MRDIKIYEVKKKNEGALKPIGMSNSFLITWASNLAPKSEIHTYMPLSRGWVPRMESIVGAA